MRDSISSIAATTIGLDLGDRYSHLCIIDEAGEISEEGRLATSKSAFSRRFGPMPPTRIAIEAGTHSHWVSRLLGSFSHQVIVANPRKMRLIYLNESKNDRVDAEYLARLGRVDPKLLFPIHHRKAETMAARALLRSRDLLIRIRTKMICHVRGLVKITGVRVPRASSTHFASKAREYIPEELEESILPVLDHIDQLTDQIKAYDRRIEELAREKYPETEVLTQIPGVGTLTALCFVLSIEDPFRFKKSREVGSYIGLRPKQADSGDHQPQLHITKAGDVLLRKLLVQCAHHILGPHGKDSDLRAWGLKLAERGGKAAKKKATIAVARKLAIVMHRLWITAEVYEPVGYEEQLAALAA